MANEAEIEATNESSYDQEIRDLQKKANMSENAESNHAIDAAINFLETSRKADSDKQSGGAPASEAIATATQ